MPLDWTKIAPLPVMRGSRSDSCRPSRRSGSIAVLDAASEEGAEPIELQIVCGHDKLAALLVRQAVAPAEFECRLDARPAELRFQAARGIVDSGMDDTAVVPGLVGSDLLLFLDDGDGQALTPPRQLQRGRKTDDASADDDYAHGDASFPRSGRQQAALAHQLAVQVRVLLERGPAMHPKMVI